MTYNTMNRLRTRVSPDVFYPMRNVGLGDARVWSFPFFSGSSASGIDQEDPAVGSRFPETPKLSSTTRWVA